MIEVLALPFLLFLLGGAGAVGYLFGSARYKPEQKLIARLHDLQSQLVDALAIDDSIRARNIQGSIDVVKATLRELRNAR